MKRATTHERRAIAEWQLKKILEVLQFGSCTLTTMKFDNVEYSVIKNEDNTVTIREFNKI